MSTASAQSVLPRPGLVTPRVGSQRQSLANFAVFTRFTLRRNWVRFLVWFLIIVGMLAFIFDYYKTLFVDPAALQDFVDTVHSPSLLAMVGIITNPASIAGATWCKYWMFGSLMLGIGVVFLMTRNLRADEDQGRAELMRSTPLGIHSRLAASVVLMSALSLVIGVFSALVLQGMTADPASVQSLTAVDSVGAAATGAWVFGLSIAAIGLLGVGIGAVVNELAPSSGAANGIGIAVFGVFYILRMGGDLNSNALTWVSPMGWAEKMDPYGANRWWPFLLVIVLTVVLAGLAWLLQSGRDLDASLLPQRGGKATASGMIQQVWGLGLRLQRGSIIGWAIGLFIFVLMIGSVIQALMDLLKQANLSGEMGAATASTDALVGVFVGMIALAISVFAAQSATTLRTDEAHGVLESQLAGGIGRISWALQRLAITLVMTIVFLLFSGILLGASYGSLIDDMSKVGATVAAFLVYLPACLVVAALFVLGFGWWPRYTVMITWIVVGILWAFMILGLALPIPEAVLNAMPFNATPQILSQDMKWTPVLILTLVVVVLTLVGLLGFRRRNVPQ